MAATFIFSNQQILDANGDPIVGAKLESYAEGATTPLATYSDEALTTANANPASGATTGNQVTGGDGRFGNIYLQSLAYKFILKDDGGNTIWTIDNFNPDGGTVALAAVPDNIFTIVDNADATKAVAFQVSGVTTGTTRTKTFQDVSGTIYETGGQDVSIADGGTGASTTSGAKTNLGLNLASVAALTALTKANLTDGERFFVSGYASANDNGGGNFYWDASSTATEITGFIEASDEGGTGRFIRETTDRIFLEMAGGVADWNSGAQTGTDNDAALTACLSWQSLYATPIHLLGRYAASGNYTISHTNAEIGGEGGHTRKSEIVLTASSGAGFTVTGRSPKFYGWAIGASNARRGQGDPLEDASGGGPAGVGITDGHGLVVGATSSGAFLSRPDFADFYVTNQPTDGIVFQASVELSWLRNITVEGCVRHGFNFNDAGGSTTIHFHAQTFNLRAYECGGHALIATDASAGVGYHVIHRNFEALNCLWKRSTDQSGILAQVYTTQSGMFFEYPDIEDQKYDQTTTATDAVSRQSNATPTVGAYLAGARTGAFYPYLSSLTRGIVAGAVEGVRIVNPVCFGGTYDTNGGSAMNPAIELPAGASNGWIEILTSQFNDCTDNLKNQSASTYLRIDGHDYIPTTLSTSDIRVDRESSDTGSITSGTASDPSATLMVYPSQSGTSDDVFTIISRAQYNGVRIAIIAASGETITYNNGNAGTAGDGNGKGLILGATTRTVSSSGGEVLVLEFNDLTDKWHEVAYFRNGTQKATFSELVADETAAGIGARTASSTYTLQALGDSVAGLLLYNTSTTGTGYITADANGTINGRQRYEHTNQKWVISADIAGSGGDVAEVAAGGVNLLSGKALKTNGTDRIKPDGSYVLPGYTAAQLADVTNAVNTTNKVTGRLVLNTTDNEVYLAQGAAAGNSWKSLEDGSTIAPV